MSLKESLIFEHEHEHFCRQNFKGLKFKLYTYFKTALSEKKFINYHLNLLASYHFTKHTKHEENSEWQLQQKICWSLLDLQYEIFYLN